MRSKSGTPGIASLAERIVEMLPPDRDEAARVMALVEAIMNLPAPAD